MSTRIFHLGTMFCCLGALALSGCGSSSSDDGGVAASGGTGGGGGGDTGGGGPVSNVPLEIDGEWVDGTTNDYGIQGAFYTYDDNFAGACPNTTVTWNPLTRCASGVLSPPGADWSCWGMGVGFDLNNSGDEGIPPSRVNPYDALANGVAGIAWTWSGTAPGLGVWVTQAEPTRMPDCDSQVVECAIEGPPDGQPNAPQSGSFTWDATRKADWGATGIPYEFDPTQLIAIQFALDSVENISLEFDFCIDSVSVIPAQ